jgi:HEAT repeat protein
MRILRAFALIGPGAKEAVPELLELLKAPLHSNVRYEIILTLFRIEPSNSAVLPALRTIIQAPDWVVHRERAAAALGELGPTAIAALPQLLDILKNERNSATTRAAAARAVAAIAPQSTQVLDLLVRELSDYDAGIRAACADGLGRIRPTSPQILQRLELNLDDDNKEVLSATQRAIEAIKKRR